MEVINNVLLFSLGEDLKGLNKIIKMVSSKSPTEEITSWLYPNRTHNSLTFLNQDEDITALPYTNILELLIDRLYIIINLVIKFFESKNEKQKLKNIQRPKVLSLSGSIELFWHTIGGSFLLRQGNKLNVDNQLINRNSESRCKSCTWAVQSIRQMAILISDNCKDSCTVKERDNIFKNIFEETQFTSIVKITESVHQDLENLIKENKSNKKNKQIMEKELDTLNIKSNMDRSYIKIIEKDKYQLENIVSQNKFEIKALSAEVSKIKSHYDEQEKDIKTQLREKVDSLNGLIDKYESKLINISAENIIVKAKIKKLRNIYDVLKKQLAIINRKVFFYETTCVETFNVLENKAKVIDRKIEFSVVIMNNIMANVSAAKKQNDENFEIVSKMFIRSKELLKLFMENMKKSNERKKDKKSPTKKLKGNPFEDMTRQIEDNIQSIKMLDKENKKFQSIINVYLKKSPEAKK